MAPKSNSPERVRIWDLPLRLFHWLLVLCVIGALVSIKLGGNWMVWHMRFGYCILALLLFRLIWGFVGGRYARFSSFVRGPAGIIGYLRGESGNQAAGHNPLGALSVLAMLALLLTQALLGLFANDDIFTEGPLVKWVSKETSDRLTGWHHFNEILIYALIGLHLAAIAFYRLARGQRLVRAMIGGDKVIGEDHGIDRSTPAAGDGPGLWTLALGLLSVCGLIVYWVVVRL